MEESSGSLDDWRKFFRGASSDIFVLIEKAILVAAVDCPKQFKVKRDQIAEKLFTSRLSRCVGCKRVVLQIAEDSDDAREEECRSVKRELGEKGSSQVDSCNCDVGDLSMVGVSNCSYDEAEKLTEVIEEEREFFGEVLRIKEVLCNTKDESDAVLYESLRRLQQMQLSVETLQATEVGKAVNGLRKHNSKQIRMLVRTLIDDWKVLAIEWMKSTAAIADQSPVNNSVEEEEEGLPSPPMDEGALLLTQTTSIQLSEVFDGMDEDGNFKMSGEVNKISNTGSRRLVSTQYPPRKPAINRPSQVSGVPPKPQGIVNRLSNPSTPDSGIVRPSKPASEQRTSNQLSGAPRKPSSTLQDKLNHFQEGSDIAKLESVKRKLHEGYQQIENAKKQRKIQVVELHDLPKSSPNQRPPQNMKPRNHSRSLPMTRR